MFMSHMLLRVLLLSLLAAAVSGTTCSDGLKNGDEVGIDCGGSCSLCVYSFGTDDTNTCISPQVLITDSAVCDLAGQELLGSAAKGTQYIIFSSQYNDRPKGCHMWIATGRYFYNPYSFTPTNPQGRPICMPGVTRTQTPSDTPSRTLTSTSTATATATRTGTPTATRTGTPTASRTQTTTNSPTQTHMFTQIRVPTQSATPTPTRTRTATDTATGIPTNVNGSGIVPTGQPTLTASPTPTASSTPTPTQTSIPTETPTPTATYTVQHISGCKAIPDYSAQGVNMSDIGLCDRSVCSARCNHPYRGEALIACSRFDGSWTLVQPCDAPLGVMSVTLSNPSRFAITNVAINFTQPVGVIAGNELRATLPPHFTVGLCPGDVECAPTVTFASALGTSTAYTASWQGNVVSIRFASNITLSGVSFIHISNVRTPNFCDAVTPYLLTAYYCPPGAKGQPLCRTMPYQWGRTYQPSDADGTVTGCSSCNGCQPLFHDGRPYYTCYENGQEFLRSPPFSDTCDQLNLF